MNTQTNATIESTVDNAIDAAAEKVKQGKRNWKKIVLWSSAGLVAAGAVTATVFFGLRKPEVVVAAVDAATGTVAV